MVQDGHLTIDGLATLKSLHFRMNTFRTQYD